MNMKSMHVNFAAIKKMLVYGFVENKNYNCLIVSQFLLIFPYVIQNIKASFNNLLSSS